MALGEQLRSARESRNVTASEIAAATRMKVQIVEDLEREDFSRIAAPIYVKGFIRLYADNVDVDPAPLIKEYEGLLADQQASAQKGRESAVHLIITEMLLL